MVEAVRHGAGSAALTTGWEMAKNVLFAAVVVGAIGAVIGGGGTIVVGAVGSQILSAMGVTGFTATAATATTAATAGGAIGFLTSPVALVLGAVGATFGAIGGLVQGGMVAGVIGAIAGLFKGTRRVSMENEAYAEKLQGRAQDQQMSQMREQQIYMAGAQDAANQIAQMQQMQRMQQAQQMPAQTQPQMQTPPAAIAMATCGPATEKLAAERSAIAAAAAAGVVQPRK